MIEFYYPFAVPYAAERLVAIGVDVAGKSPDELLACAREAGIAIHFLKRVVNARVRRTLGFVRALRPERCLDVGSGNGHVVWGILAEELAGRLWSVDLRERIAARLAAVARVASLPLSAARMDACRLGYPDRAFDLVILTEVLEHLVADHAALAEAVRVSRSRVLVSVPTKPDESPDHLRGYDSAALERLLRGAGIERWKTVHGPDRLFALAERP